MSDTAAVQTSKQRRYDRQLRLWGEHGQAAMEDCHVCLINGSACGAETLKNLVLPGIGSFTIVDSAVVTEADLGNNFFIEKSFLGKSRAACVTQMLQEMNEHVKGAYVAEDISQILEARPDFLHSFGMVIATQLPTKDLLQVAAICSSRSIPLIAVQCYGFLGYLRLMLNEHQVVEVHPQHEVPDLRALVPPPALLSFISERYSDLGSLSTAEYAHIPYVVLLVKAAQQWSASNGGALPLAYKQKKEVKAIVEGYRRTDTQADVNIDEALNAINTAFALPAPKSSLAKLHASARERVSRLAAELHELQKTGASADAPAPLDARRQQLGFWVMAAALAGFVAAEGQGNLPVVGTIPDMTAHTETYVALQNIYQQQAQVDFQAVQGHVQQLCTLESLPADLVSVEQIKLVCKNAQHLMVDEFRPLAAELSAETACTDQLSAALADDASSGSLYVLMLAAHAYRAERSCWPGQDDVEGDVPQFKQFVGEVLKMLGLYGGSCPIEDDAIHEFCRWGGAEMHAIASVMGGVASQEAIKAVTHQYVPLNNTFIFNGATGTTAVLTL